MSLSGARIGILAGLVLLVARMIASRDPLQPFRLAAQVFAGHRLDESDVPVGTLIVVGLAVHVTLSVFYGLIYFWLHRLWNGDLLVPFRRRALSGALFGLLVWLLDFHLFARLLRPWLASGPELVEGLLHAFAYGLPLALTIGLHERRARLIRTGS